MPSTEGGKERKSRRPAYHEGTVEETHNSTTEQFVVLLQLSDKPSLSDNSSRLQCHHYHNGVRCGAVGVTAWPRLLISLKVVERYARFRLPRKMYSTSSAGSAMGMVVSFATET